MIYAIANIFFRILTLFLGAWSFSIFLKGEYDLIYYPGYTLLFAISALSWVFFAARRTWPDSLTSGQRVTLSGTHDCWQQIGDDVDPQKIILIEYLPKDPMARRNMHLIRMDYLHEKHHTAKTKRPYTCHRRSLFLIADSIEHARAAFDAICSRAMPIAQVADKWRLHIPHTDNDNEACWLPVNQWPAYPTFRHILPIGRVGDGPSAMRPFSYEFARDFWLGWLGALITLVGIMLIMADFGIAKLVDPAVVVKTLCASFIAGIAYWILCVAYSGNTDAHEDHISSSNQFAIDYPYGSLDVRGQSLAFAKVKGVEMRDARLAIHMVAGDAHDYELPGYQGSLQVLAASLNDFLGAGADDCKDMRN